jgi:hypothetical protein
MERNAPRETKMTTNKGLDFFSELVEDPDCDVGDSEGDGKEI